MKNSTGDCDMWKPAEHPLLKIAMFCFTIAFLIPHKYRFAIVLMRGAVNAGLIVSLLWGLGVCSPDVLMWNLAFLMINSYHIGDLTWHLLPARYS